MINALIIDDVHKLRESLRDFVEKFCPQVNIIGEADGVKSGIEMIRSLKPGLIFLDVEMGDGTGFDMLEQLMPLNFKVIFITAYSEHAIKAFRCSAVDYILKPVDKDELIAAVKKAEDALEKESFEVRLKALFSNANKVKNEPKKLVLRTAEKIYSVNIQDIVRCESFKNYTEFFMKDGEKMLTSVTLKEYEELLEPHGFFRVHQSHLINMDYINHFIKADGGMAVMRDKSKVPVSSRKKEEFIRMMESK